MSLLVEIPVKSNYIINNINQIKNINIINKIYCYLINNNYILKKSNTYTNNKLLYFINKNDFSEVIKIIINNDSNKVEIILTIPLKNSNYEYTTKFNNLDKTWNYLKFHISYLNSFKK